MLRIIAGKYRHLIIDAPNTEHTRPTTDKVREALMSALGDNLIDAVVLDLFAGSGALGLESLSRGAKKVFFCDNSFLAVKTINQNIKRIRIEEEYEVHKCSYSRMLEILKEREEKIDILFLDPPYIKENYYNKVVDYMFENNLFSENAVVVKECNKEIEYDDRFLSHKRYKYGTINVLIERR